VTDFGVLPDGRAYLVMELIAAPTLGRMLKEGPLAPLRAVRILRALADAVDAVHNAGVVHGDLKPSNVFVLEDERIKLSDFGTASFERAHGGSARPGPLGLTPSYAAPEAGEGITADRRFDVYALGCVLFEAVTGRVPYRGESPLGTLRMHRTSPVPKAAEIPPFLADIIERALAKEPAVRYQTAGAMVEDLDRAVAILTAAAALATSVSTPGRVGVPEGHT
jgi:serine/threonine-protein kinase